MVPPTALAAPALARSNQLLHAALEHGRGLAGAVAASFLRHRWMVALVLLYLAAAFLVEMKSEGNIDDALTLYSGLYFEIAPMMVLALLLGYPIYVLIAVRPERAFAEIARRLRTSVFTVDRIANALPVLVLMPIFLNSFTIIKTSIPVFSPYRWDSALEVADRRLHGGEAPWQILHPLLGQPWITHTFSFGYALWFFVVWLSIIWQTFSNQAPRLRAQFFGTMMLSWILIGSVASFLFSSAGPCYFGRITGLADPYAPLMNYLRQTNAVTEIFAITAQEQLWSYYASGSIGLGGGISAMPSMHVAMAFLLVLLAGRTHWAVGVAAFLYYLVILIGSVHLGWHYAIDGYVATLAAAAIWWAVGRALDWHASAASRTERGAVADTAGA
jgi:hypothetical protein